MSSLKKMKLIPIEEQGGEGIEDLINIASIAAPANLKKASDLDFEIKRILNSEYNDRVKSKLYGQALKRFLTAKGKYEAEENAKRQKDSVTKLTDELKPLLKSAIKTVAPKTRKRVAIKKTTVKSAKRKKY